MKPLPALALLALSFTPNAQIIVEDGDDLAAIVAAAPDGSVVEIQSDATFEGKLQWEGKTLTVRAGAGYQPTVRGLGTDAAVDLPYELSPTGATGAILEGLVLESEAGGIAVWARGYSAPAYLQLMGCTVVQDTRLSSYSGMSLVVSIEGCVLLADLRTFSNDGTTQATVRDSDLNGGAITAQGTGSATATFERCRSTSGFYASTNYATATAKGVFRSCLLARDGGSPVGLSTGLPSDGTPVIVAQNCTIAHFVVGLSLNDASDAVNMLVFDSVSDIGGSTPSSAVRDSMIEDGTFDGVNGNFAGSPVLDGDYALYPCSPGVDAGNAALFVSELWDLNQDPRSQDGDGDGLANLNVGAVETVVAAPAMATPYNGTGVNPNGFGAITMPVIGTTLELSVSLAADTITTLVGFDLPAASPYELPGFVDGELFLALSAALILDVAPLPGGLHGQPLPCDPSLVGATLRAQGFRVSALATQALNGLDLTLGTQ